MTTKFIKKLVIVYPKIHNALYEARELLLLIDKPEQLAIVKDCVSGKTNKYSEAGNKLAKIINSYLK